MNDSSWFTILKTSHKNKGLEAENPMIGILSFEVSRLMCKVANLWHCLTDRHVSRLKEELRYSLGIRTLISDDHSYLIDLALSEIIDNLKGVSISVARLGKKCVDPMYHNLDHVFHNPFEINLKWCGWEYRLKKMEKRVKKMKKFANVMSQLHEELETLSDLETRLKKMQSNGVNQSQLLEFHQKVMWQREEVNGLRDMSPWVRTFDYIVRLLLRSLFTIVERIKVVFGITTEMGRDGCFVRKYSISTLAGASVYPSETSSSRSMSNLRHTPNPQTCYSPIMCARYPSIKSAHIGCTTSRSNPNSIRVKGIFQNDAFDPIKKAKRLSKGQEPTLGDTALALRYANIIIFIENLAMSPRYLRPDAREDLYDMLTTGIKNSLRQKLFLSSKKIDHRVASDWRSSLKRILDWLSPVAHNMIKWYSERNFEKQPMGSKGQVLLVQTLHYADQATSEIAITELLVGLHHVWRFSQEIIDKSLMGSA
ncbi:protein PSK SIMULATOR 1 isoform X1 [Lactuca sativa]|uniref:protein PSK SIMULATOR 1 isoform X1 n=1 Tax=Lactuca sativa TaxID=4236 RepID=UPI000CB08142|nr:protein PSK SIMULATOR 1 isoform X1 [Lactuca sativa]